MVSFGIVLSIQDSTKILLFVIIKASHPKFLNLQLMAAVQVLAVGAPMVVPVGAMEAPGGSDGGNTGGGDGGGSGGGSGTGDFDYDRMAKANKDAMTEEFDSSAIQSDISSSLDGTVQSLTDSVKGSLTALAAFLGLVLQYLRSFLLHLLICKNWLW